MCWVKIQPATLILWQQRFAQLANYLWRLSWLIIFDCLIDIQGRLNEQTSWSHWSVIIGQGGWSSALILLLALAFFVFVCLLLCLSSEFVCLFVNPLIREDGAVILFFCLNWQLFVFVCLIGENWQCSTADCLSWTSSESSLVFFNWAIQADLTPQSLDMIPQLLSLSKLR